MACREPVQAALDILNNGTDRIATVTDDEIAAAIRILFSDTHNLAEGAGAAALAALMQDAPNLQGKKAGIILSGGNLDETALQTVLTGGTPVV
jgi:threonine dehydratase